MLSVEHYVEVDVPAERAYAWWHGLTNLPAIMDDLKSVRPDPGDPQLTHWKMKGPLGTTVSWDARIVEDVPNARITWTAVEPTVAKHTGVVRFDDRGDRTGVELSLQYDLPGGVVGRAMARLLADPKREVAEALGAFKRTMENRPAS
jgi:uncharacterized membrane protein